MRSATLSGFGQGAGPVLRVRFEPPEFDPPQAAASRVSTMKEKRKRILAILGVRDTLRGLFAEERCRRRRVSARSEDSRRTNQLPGERTRSPTARDRTRSDHQSGRARSSLAQAGERWLHRQIGGGKKKEGARPARRPRP